MDFTLTDDDAAVLRHLASVDPATARCYLQDRPELARRMTNWPPEIRLEVCRILWLSFPADRRDATVARRRGGTDLLELLSRG